MTTEDAGSRVGEEDVSGAPTLLAALGKYEEKEEACWHRGPSSPAMGWNSTKVKEDRVRYFREKAKAAQRRYYTSRQELLDGRGTSRPRGPVMT